MRILSLLPILFASSVAALPAAQATPTSPPPIPTGSPQQPPPEPFLPTGAPIATDIAETNPTPTPIYSTLTPKVPSNSPGPAPPQTRSGLRLDRNPHTNRRLHLGRRPRRRNRSRRRRRNPHRLRPRDYASLIPPAPGVTPRPEPNLAQMGYYQTTYYSCVTREASVHCGWHRPIMVAPANNAAGSPATGRGARIWMLVAGAVAVLVAG
ncbi:hypothetical protein Ct61P_09198 [Colletotrichum tofieldiae]|nr:hypothetical protein Ct61P_09198 [Colletotrichum tofieldiae]